METPLGYVSAGLAPFPVKNAGTTVIPIGSVVSLEVGTTAVIIGEEQAVLYVKKADATYQHYCGIALTPMGVGEGGTICMMGPCLCLVEGNVLLAPLISSAVDVTLNSNTLSLHDGTASTSDGVIRGVALEAAHTLVTAPDFGGNTTYFAYCWVNFTASRSFGYT